VKDIAEFNESVPESELFSFLYDRVVSKEISSFSQLKTFAAPALKDKRSYSVLLRLFDLIKKLNWGYFGVITAATHKKLWWELVIPDKTFPEAGDLKRMINMETKLHICMLDIHGYTKFCQDSRKNPSMLSTLDKAINGDLQRLATQCGAICSRERGDEIVVICASSTDALTVTLGIMDYFGKTNVVNDLNISTKRTGDAAILPLFKLSAGITGGDIKTPLVITEQGTLTGFLLNMGARLQSRANELSPKESRIMITKQVALKFQKENTIEKSALSQNKAVYFFDTGTIEFKGVQILTCEVVFKQEERYKEQFSEELQRLFGSIRENLWEQRIFMDLMELLSKVAHEMPPFQVTPETPVNSIKMINNDSFMQLSRMGLKLYIQDEDYQAAIGLLHSFIDIAGLIPGFDRLILDYTKGVADKYDILLNSYNSHIDREIDEKAAQIFQGNNHKTWLAAKNGAAIYEKLRVIGRKSDLIVKKKVLWFNLVKQHQDEMVFTLYSGKK
jgi:hypothetical protein